MVNIHISLKPKLMNRYPTTAHLSIKGVIHELGKNLPCRVRLFEKITGEKVAEVATNEQGEYEFHGLRKSKFVVIAHHTASQFNAVIQDNVVPK